MRVLRRSLQVVALAGTLLVGVVALALIVSQTPWFRDWLRRYVVRESKQYLNGELSIGSLGGNLLFGVQVNDVALDMSGERVVAAKNIEVDYSVFRIISQGVVLDGIKVVQPEVRLERDASGWNLARLVKKQEKEAEREGPGSPLTLESIEIADASVTIVDRVGAEGYTLPERIEDIDLKASYAYEPVHYSVVVDRASLRTSSPQMALTQLAGKVAVRDDNLYVDGVTLSTGESTLTIDGVVENYLETPVLQITTTGSISLPEIGRVAPAAAGYTLHPAFTIRASGPAERLGLEIDMKSEAGTVRGALTADVKAPDFAAKGSVAIARLNLAPLLNDPAQKSDLTGRADVDVRVAAGPADAPIVDRLSGTFRVQAPAVAIAGYRAADVHATGRIDGSRLTVDGRAAAYGGTATTKGTVVLPAEGRPLQLDLAGGAERLDLRNLPRELGVPRLATNVSVSEYRIAGTPAALTGSAALNESEIEGARLATGTVGTFTTGRDGITFSARGNVASLNLPRLGRAMEIPALDNPAYDGTLNADFDVKGALPPATTRSKKDSALAVMQLDATGTLRDSSIMGGSLPEVGFEAHIAEGGLTARVDGRFEGFDPSRLANRPELKGTVSGTVDATARIADLTAPITPAAMQAEGQVALGGSDVGGLHIDTASIQAKYAGEVADIAKFQLTGPDLRVEAAGRLALDRTSTSDLKYHVEGIDLTALAALAGQKDVSGTVVLDGTMTGNAASLQTTGTLDGSNLGYGENTALDLNSTYTATVPDLAFAKATVEADTTATFVKAGGLEINTLTAKTTYADSRIDFTTSLREETRELDASGQVILHPDHQEVHLPKLAVRTQGVEWTTAPGAEAAIQYGNDRITLENVKLVSGAQVIDASGAFALKGDTPAGDLKVKIENLDLAQAERLMLMERGLGGTLTAEATITGTAAAPAVDGHVEIRNGSFQDYTYESLVANVDYAGDRVGIDAVLQQSPTESITVKGSTPTALFTAESGPAHVEPTGADQVDLHIRSSALNLGVLQSATTALTDVTGTVEADLRITGAAQDPHIEGYVDVKGGSFAIPVGGTRYTGLDTRISLESQGVRIEKFAIRDEHGQPLNVSGELALHARKVGAVNISIDSDNFEVIDNELGDVGIDSNVTITGELRRPVVQGKVRLEAARLEVDKLLALFYDPYSVESLPSVVSAERTVETAGTAEEATAEALRKAQETAAVPATRAEAEAGEAARPTGIFAATTIDMRLEIPDNLVLRGKNLRPGGPTGASIGNMNITVGGDIQLVKPADGEMVLLGTVDTVRGTYEFQGRRFELQRGGSLRFLGEPQPNPALDIRATRVIPNTGVEVTVRVQGTAKAPQLQLSSNPPLEESDILALIVFNRPVNELGSGERASLAATAGGIATGFIAAPLGESIGRALDLDLFEINTTTDDGDLGASLTLGQQVADKAFFRLRQQFGERSTTEFLLDYQLSRFLRLQTTAAPETTGSANRIGQRRIERAGIDLIFFFSY